MPALVVPRPIGWKLISRGRALPCTSLADLAEALAREQCSGCTAARAVARTSLTRDRELTQDERRELIELATELIEKELV